ncbi:MAG: hypothetical protein R3E96_06245 [Planctomycetota bacterium]
MGSLHTPDVYTRRAAASTSSPVPGGNRIGNAVLDDDIRLKFVVQ